MSKRLILVLTFAFVVGIAFAAYAEVQNIKVGGDLLIRGLARSEFQLDETAEKEDAILGAVRLRVDADLTDNVAATVRILNERDWGHEAGSTNEMDLDLAYVTVKELLDSPVTLVAGRQELRYGNALIIGDPDTNGIASAQSQLATTHTDLSLRKAFDAMKVTLDYDPLIVDMVYATIEENTTTQSDDVTLLGLNANYMVNSDLLSELYFWSRDREVGSVSSLLTGGNGERLNVFGARALYTGVENLMLGLEGAYQFGDHITDTDLYPDDARTAGTKSTVSAYAIQFTSNYVFSDMDYTPSVRFNYTRLSGEKDQVGSEDSGYRGWSPMFEDQAGGTIFNKLVGYSNAQLFNVGASVIPMEDLTVALDWHHIRILQTMNTAADASRTLSGVRSDTTYNVVGGKRHLADELDLNITYDYTEDVQFGLNTGVYFPGSVYAEDNNEKPTQIIGSMKVTF